jgi:hypothetical protein
MIALPEEIITEQLCSSYRQFTIYVYTFDYEDFNLTDARSILFKNPKRNVDCIVLLLNQHQSAILNLYSHISTSTLTLRSD